MQPMILSGWLELRLALAGALRLALGDRRGLSYFDRSAEGFWRSFSAAFIAYPLFLLVLLLHVGATQWAASGGFRILLVATIGYVISWVAFPLAMVSLTRALGREERFFDFMVAYNWCQLPQAVLFTAVAIEAASVGPGHAAVQAIGLAAVLAVLVYEWFIARVALEITGLLALLVVLVDFVLSELVNRAALALI